MLLLFISFLAGTLTVLAPCVLPLLPIIIGGSLSGNNTQRSRPYVIAGALAGSIIVFTLILKVSTVLINLSPDVLTDVSGGLIVALGFVGLFPGLWEKLIIHLNWQATTQRFLGSSERREEKYAGPILIGVALGPVFASCSPTYAFILASVLPKNFVGGLIYLIVYSAGLVITLLAVSLLGRKFISKFQWAINTHGLFRRGIGVLFIAIGLTIISGQELKIEVWLGNHLPFDETRIERVLLSDQHTPIAKSLSPNRQTSARSSYNVLNVQSTTAPQFQNLTNWINSKPLTLSKLKGKVVLVDFWTYSCVNCNRALPYVEKWYRAYQADGLVVVGVHTPEFAFEHNPANVQNAVTADGITYPVALDNNYATWNAYNNDSWPADYLIDKGGKIRYVSLGEGNYNITEEAIQELLGLHQALQTPVSVVPISANQTPETYFGTYRDSNYSGAPSLSNGTYSFNATSDESLGHNHWTLGGKWQIGTYNITSTSNTSTLTFNASAKDIYVVAGSTNNQTEAVQVMLPSSVAGDYGNDAPSGVVTVGMSRLYHIVSLRSFKSTTVTLTVPAGVSLYTFTFGS